MGQPVSDVIPRVATILPLAEEFVRSMEPRSLAPPRAATIMPNVEVCARDTELIFNTSNALRKDVRTMPSMEECASSMEQQPRNALPKDVRTMLSTAEYASSMAQKSKSVSWKVVRIKPMTE
jgi:hypothetical protein